MFTYQDDYHEIDIEASRWGIPSGNNMSFTVEPPQGGVIDATNHHSFMFTGIPVVNKFLYQSDKIVFDSGQEHWQYPGSYIPKSGTEKVHFNLWLLQGQPPADNMEQEVVISAFRFTPLNKGISPALVIAGLLVAGAIGYVQLEKTKKPKKPKVAKR
jgi:hypothetical protein